MKLSRKFYSRGTKDVAIDLLGKILVHETPKGILKGRIVETEAYLGSNDPGSIGCRKVKNVPKSLLNPPGYSFVYFTYGNHWMLNVNAKDGKLGAVLIRAVEPLDGIDEMKKRRKTDNVLNIASGPGKLTQAFGIDKGHDGMDMTKGCLYILDSGKKIEFVRTTRIGLSDGKEKLLRFYIKGSRFVSRLKQKNQHPSS